MGIFDGKKDKDSSEQDPTEGKKVDSPVKGFKYRVKCNCVVDGVYRKEGEIVVCTEKSEVPHYSLIEEGK